MKKWVSYSFSWKNWKIENMFLSVEWKVAKKKTDMSGIKGVDKKCHVENDKKKGFLLLWKMFVWIKEDRDSVTRPKSENVEKKWKCWKN